MKHQRIRTKPLLIKDGREFIKKFNDFLDYCEMENKIPFRSGFCIWLGISETCMNDYNKRPEFDEAYGLMKATIHDCVLNGAMTKEYSDKISMLVLKNHHNYIDTATIEPQSSQPQSHTIEIVAAQPPKPSPETE